MIPRVPWSGQVILAGRAAECARLDRLLDIARAEHAGVLVLRGEAGIGKTALLSYAAERARAGEYHLHNVFTKLEISSRAELSSVLPGGTRDPQPF
jgi:predicted ATPase